MQQTTPEPSDVRQKMRNAGFSLLSIIGKRPAMEKWEIKIDVNLDETIVTSKNDADELYRCVILINANHDFRDLLTRVFHDTDVEGRA